MSPLLLVVILVGMAVVALLVLGRDRSAGDKRRAAPSARRQGSAQRWRRRAVVLMVLTAVTLGLAFTQFRLQRQRTAPATVVLAIDVSESMNRTDIRPSRLEAAKAAALAFLGEVPSDLLAGLVTFAAEARTLVPPTDDRAQVEAALTDPVQGEGTVIGDGLSAALDAIEADGSEGVASIVLLSDGRDTGSAVSPDEAATRAQELDVTIYTVVLGEAKIDETGAGANVDLMNRVATTTGGSTYSAATAGSLLQVYRSLGSQLSTEVDITDYGAMLVGLAALLAIAATVALLLSLRADY
jgi:Ca-activated chloride channel homolog